MTKINIGQKQGLVPESESSLIPLGTSKSSQKLAKQVACRSVHAIEILKSEQKLLALLVTLSAF